LSRMCWWPQAVRCRDHPCTLIHSVPIHRLLLVVSNDQSEENKIPARL
jgi:hypothetical protein